MTREIDFSFLLTVLKKAWWKILLIVLAVAIVTVLFSHFFIPKKYTQEVVFRVVNDSLVSEYTNTGLVEAAMLLAQDYIRIINSDISLKAIAEKANEKGYDLSAGKISGMLSSKAASESAIFSIYVTDEDPKLAFDIANIVEDVAPDIIKSISKPSTDLDIESIIELAYNNNESDDAAKKEAYNMLKAKLSPCVTVLSTLEYHENPSSPNISKNTMFASLITLVATYIIFFIIAFLDVTIRTKDDVRKNIKAPLIGTIPTWELDTTAKGGK
ncbi:MAG: hypothetical protein J6Q78_00220 [Clostridia bacterium]|nr:hypothetical protein [Clostridia bacterium]